MEVIFLVFIHVAFCASERLHGLFLYFTGTVVNIRDAVVVGVYLAFALIDYVSSKYFNFNPFVLL